MIFDPKDLDNISPRFKLKIGEEAEVVFLNKISWLCRVKFKKDGEFAMVRKQSLRLINIKNHPLTNIFK